ncbi:hypothetical protein ACW9HF_21480, partial [Nocardia gipuzkoensis]
CGDGGAAMAVRRWRCGDGGAAMAVRRCGPPAAAVEPIGIHTPCPAGDDTQLIFCDNKAIRVAGSGCHPALPQSVACRNHPRRLAAIFEILLCASAFGVYDRTRLERHGA